MPDGDSGLTKRSHGSGLRQVPAIYAIDAGSGGSGFSTIALGLVTGLCRLGVPHRFYDLRLLPSPAGKQNNSQRSRLASRSASVIRYAWRLGIRGWKIDPNGTASVHHLVNQLLARTFKRRPLILTLDNIAPLRSPENRESSLLKKTLYRSIVNSARYSADAVICPTYYMKRQAIAEGIPEDRVRVIPYSTELPDRPAFDPATIRRTLPATRILLSVGGEQVRKRVDLQIRAAKLLPDWTLVRLFPGSGPSPPIRKLISDLGMESRVVYVNPPRGMEHAYALSMYLTADALIHTATYGSFEFVPVEAALARLPVIAPHLDPMKELLRGLLFVDDFELPRELAEAVERSKGWQTDIAFESARQYTHLRQASAVSSLYQEIVE